MPLGGMFLWIKCLGVADTHPMIMKRALKKDVILLPGREFMTDPSQPCPYMRASFSLASAENIDRVRWLHQVDLVFHVSTNRIALVFSQGFRNLAQLIREEMATSTQ